MEKLVLMVAMATFVDVAFSCAAPATAHSNAKKTFSKSVNLGVLSWNTSGMREDSVDTLVSQLNDMDKQQDVILIQESCKSEDVSLGSLDAGHVWYVAPCYDRPRKV